MIGVELGVMDWSGRNRDEMSETTCIVGHVRAFEEEVSNARESENEQAGTGGFELLSFGRGSRNAPTRRRLRRSQE